jgi:DNA-binding response OmpR family regulator
MSKKVVVLADNSYTIRRIVELSFSEIENIEVRSFENGSAIKEKLLQLSPAVVIVDIKLPELNGYDLCRFVNETPSLNRTRVFLMKGSFEPVDNDMIKNLKYEDIITKPFDSNALVSAVMKIVNQEGSASEIVSEGPDTFPEDFPEIETDAPESEGISFSDIHGEMQAPPVAERPLSGGQGLEREEILPSEEITQGTQPLKDNLMPQETEEALKNPFEEEPAFEEISAAPSAAAGSPPIEYEKDPLSGPPTANVGAAKDASDEFHERFLEIANEDTSEDLLKPTIGTPLVDSDDLQFPAELKDEKAPADENKISLEFEQTDMVNPAQTLHAGSDVMADFMAAGAKPEKHKAAEPAAEKARPESLSPQDELDRLAGPPKKEPKADAKASVEPPLPDKFELTGKLEEKLGLTIKELLWEIVPPMAEKIIKEEIDKIKSDLNNNSL